MSNLSKDKLNILDDLTYRSKNPRQALKTLDKWMKKDAQNPYMQYLKGKITLECGEHEKALDIGLTLAKQQPFTQDANFIRDVHNLVSRCQRQQGSSKFTVGAEITKMWQAAVQNPVVAKRCILEWFSVAIDYEQWEDAQAAMSQLRRIEPNEPANYFFFAAVTQTAAERLESSDDKKSTLLKTLTLRMLDMAVKSTSPPTSSKNIIESPTTLDLTINIYQRQRKFSELLDLLHNTTIGIDSKIALPIRSKLVKLKLSILMELRQWQEAMNFCQILLRESTGCSQVPDATKDKCCDWAVMDFLIRAGENVGPKSFEDCESLIKGYQKSHLSYFCERNAMLAWVKLQDMKFQTAGATQRTSDDLSQASNASLDACSDYFRRFCEHNCCFSDLRPIVEKFNTEQESMWKSRIELSVDGEYVSQTSRGQIARAINKLKFEYLNIMAAPGDDESRLKRLHILLQDCLGLVKPSSSDDSSPFREGHILIAAILVKIYQNADSPTRPAMYLLLAICVLRKTTSESKEDRVASLFIVRLYLLLGCGSLAMREYKKLRVKGIMHENYSNVINTRLATTHPRLAVTENMAKSFDDLDENPSLTSTTQPLRYYEDTIQATDGKIVDTLKSKSPSLFMDLVELKSDLSRSFTRQLLILERRRALRLCQRPADELEMFPAEFNLADFKDKRDKNTMLDFDPAFMPTMDSRIKFGPTPRRYWLAISVVIDDTLAILSETRRIRKLDVEVAQDIIEKANAAEQNELTEAEQSTWKHWMVFRSLLKDVMEKPTGERSTTLAVSSAEMLNRAKAIPVEAKAILKPCEGFALGENLHTLVAYLEILQAYIKLCTCIISQAKSRKLRPEEKKSLTDIEAVVASIRSSWNEMCDLVRQEREKLSAKEPVDLMASVRNTSQGSASIHDLVGTKVFEVVTKSCIDSGRKALDDILTLKANIG